MKKEVSKETLDDPQSSAKRMINVRIYAAVSKAEFDVAIIALAHDIVESAEFADPRTEGHQSKGDMAYSMADFQTYLDNRASLIANNPTYDLPLEEKQIFEDGADAIYATCEAWGIENPIEQYYPESEEE